MPDDDVRQTRFVCPGCTPFARHFDHHHGLVTVHGTDSTGGTDSFTVWCPWCGDKMEPLEEASEWLSEADREAIGL